MPRKGAQGGDKIWLENDGAGAQPRIRRGDESPDGDLALVRPRRASASPGVASASSPTLRVSSPRRSRMRPSPLTNGHESLECALRNRAALNRAGWNSGASVTGGTELLGQETLDMRREESRFELVYRLTSSLSVSRLTSHAPVPHSPFFILHFPLSIFHSCSLRSRRIRERRRRICLGGRRKPVGLDAARHISRRTLSMSW